MPFTATELANIANAAFNFHIKGPAMAQSIQEKPLYKAMKAAQKEFPGGKETIVQNVKGQYSTRPAGYTHDDSVTYGNPANIKAASYPWKEIHAGISVTLTELKKDGISVVDSMDGADTVEHSDVEETRITSLLADKLDDMSEGWNIGFNDMLWRDGTQDSKTFVGIKGLLSETPTTGVVGGIDRGLNSWWRNRALTAATGTAIASSTTNQTLMRTLRKEFRQLKRFGGNPTLFLCGSDFLDALEAEVMSKGLMTQDGFKSNGKTDIGMADVSWKGNQFVYDPTLDDYGQGKYCYAIDPKHLFPRVMEGEDMKQHTPARPYDRYVIYRAMTWTGGLIADQMNCHGIYAIA